MSDFLFGLALVWFVVIVAVLTWAALRAPAGSVSMRPFPWLVLAALVALAALAHVLGY